jgi:hypothetical protein
MMAVPAAIRDVYDGSLTTDIQVETFRHMERLFPVRVIERGTHVAALPRRAGSFPKLEFRSAGGTYDLVDYLALNRVTGLLVLKNGQIALEDYEMGNCESTRWPSMSVAKTITSTLVGAALHDGGIGSIDDPVTAYVPRLSGTAYEGVSIRILLQMASGVAWDETYTKPGSDRRRMLDAQIEQRGGAILDLIAALPRAAPPGTVWNYSTGETFVAGAVVAAAVGRPLAEYLSERIWRPAGMESDATWWLESPGGLEVGGSGVSATLRDYGRFGAFLMNGGVAHGGARILPENWIREAASERLIGGKPTAYGYMIWPLDGGFEARGIFGQHLYMNPREQVVIVVWGAQTKPTGRAVVHDPDFFAAVTAALR